LEPPSQPPARRTLTPAVLLAALFTTACAGVSIAYVAGHGGLELPGSSPRSSAIAAASASPAAGPPGSPEPGQSAGASPSPEPALSSSPGPSPAGPSLAPTPVASIDPLTALPVCPDHPGCYLYTVKRGDTLSTIGDHWLIGLSILEALNPEVSDPSTIVVGQTIYLGRSPIVRLDGCPDTPGCYLYVVRSGDRLSTIAGRYGTTTTAILALNPSITNANEIHTGQTIRIPGP
jgi:nucleoid-associated protein YgaU